jgi:hypothetical protein
MPKIDYKKREITLVGRTQDTEEDKACGVCKEADDYISSRVKNDNRITYSKIEVDTPEGEKIAEEADIRSIPYIKDCKTFTEGGKQRCKEYEGFEKDDWEDLDQILEKKEEKKVVDKYSSTSEQLEAEQKAKAEREKVDTESGIKEPSEPSEPIS